MGDNAALDDLMGQYAIRSVLDVAIAMVVLDIGAAVYIPLTPTLFCANDACRGFYMIYLFKYSFRAYLLQIPIWRLPARNRTFRAIGLFRFNDNQQLDAPDVTVGSPLHRLLDILVFVRNVPITHAFVFVS